MRDYVAPVLRVYRLGTDCRVDVTLLKALLMNMTQWFGFLDELMDCQEVLNQLKECKAFQEKVATQH